MRKERPIHRHVKPVYEMSLCIYPVALCGEDLQTGSPIKVSAKGEDLYALKCRTNELLLSAVKCGGKCLVEMTITEDGRYHDRDEWWCTVDPVQKKVDIGGHYDG